MTHQVSRRVFLTGVGGGGVAASLVWGVRELAVRGPGLRADHRVIGEGSTYAEYDGWLVTIADRDRLSRALVYGRGWHRREANEETTWRWTQQVATLSFPDPQADVMLHLVCRGRLGLFADAPRVAKVSVGSHVLHSFVVDVAGRQRISIRLPATELRRESTVEIQIAVDRTFVPAEHGANTGDTRELGVAVYDAHIERAPS